MATTTVAPPSGAGTSRTGAARTAFLLLAAVAALTVALCASVMFGSRSTSFGDVLGVLGGTADDNVTAIIESRYPRTALGVLAGLCLAVAGTLMQGVSRNPLAEPGLLGINAGASASIVAATAWFGASGATDTMWWALPRRWSPGCSSMSSAPPVRARAWCAWCSPGRCSPPYSWRSSRR